MSTRRRRHARSPAVRTPLDDDDLLSEILLRLPPQPSSLPRASVVCKRWRGIVSDPGFLRRFRFHHRRNPPLLGFFDKFSREMSFIPTMEAPNRIPPVRFSLQRNDNDISTSLGCRHGLFLIFFWKRFQFLVWDPVTGDQHRIAIPAAFDTKIPFINGAVLRAAGDDQHFQVVLAVADVHEEQHEQATACVYSSKTGLWGNPISTPLPHQPNGRYPYPVYTGDAVLVGDCLHWRLAANLAGILEFDLKRQSLAVIRVPVDMYGKGNPLTVMHAKGGGLGLLVVSKSDCNAQLWKRTTDCDGVASWGLSRTIELDKLLSLKPEEKGPLFILGFAEENNVVFLWTIIGLFMIHLDSFRFRKLFDAAFLAYYHPFESVYTAGAHAGSGHDGDELLLST